MKRQRKFQTDFSVTRGIQVTNDQETSVKITITYKDNEKTIHEEILVYNALEMVSQLGGILSLFLGFSFFSLICDFLEMIEKKIL